MAESENSNATPPLGRSAKDRLARDLRFASQLFYPGAEDGGRIGVIMTLTALDRFMMTMFGVEEPPLFVPLRQLQYALHDLNNGKIGPLLTAKKVKNRPPNSAAVEGFRAFAAVALDLFIEGGVPRKQAAADVAKALRRVGYTFGPGKIIKAARVEDWRDRLLKDSPADNPAAGRFQRTRQQLTAMFPNNPTAAARFVLERLPLVARIPKKPP